MDRPALKAIGHALGYIYGRHCCPGYWNGAGFECSDYCECTTCTDQREAY